MKLAAQAGGACVLSSIAAALLCAQSGAVLEWNTPVTESGRRVPGPVASPGRALRGRSDTRRRDRKSTRLNSSHLGISDVVFCLKKAINSVSVVAFSVLLLVSLGAASGLGR